LVVDVRRNAGGGMGVLRELYPYFVDPGTDKPRVVHVAGYRLNQDKKEAADAKEGYLQDRLLFPATSAVWSDEERDAVTKLTKDFAAEWQPPAQQFSAWHATVLSPRKGGPYYHYDKPVVVLADAGCVGAADVFLGAFKGLKNVTLMGTPSGGATSRPEAVRLANSGVGVQLSTTANYRPDGKLYDGRGVEPDVVAWPVPNDFIGRTDAVLEAAVKKLQQP
jgi:C-terminal processing protease CtpA/Prc